MKNKQSIFCEAEPGDQTERWSVSASSTRQPRATPCLLKIKPSSLCPSRGSGGNRFVLDPMFFRKRKHVFKKAEVRISTEPFPPRAPRWSFDLNICGDCRAQTPGSACFGLWLHVEHGFYFHVLFSDFLRFVNHIILIIYIFMILFFSGFNCGWDHVQSSFVTYSSFYLE